MSGKTFIIAGNGASAADFQWPERGMMETWIMAISGGYRVVPWMDDFVSLDRPCDFPEHVRTGPHFRNVAVNALYHEWRQFNPLRGWQYTGGDWPDFRQFMNSPLVTGPLPRNNSLLFGVQVAARMGFKRMIFVGCDLQDDYGPPECPSLGSDTSFILQGWHDRAQACGIEWLAASPRSRLAAWMPLYEPEAVAV